MAKKIGLWAGAACIAICTALLIIAVGIAVPIFSRELYYRQIDRLQLCRTTGYSEAVIRQAYDAVMDYLVKGTAFSTGQLRYSMDGQAHFADCQGLFRLDFAVGGVCAAVLCVFWGIARHRRRRGLPGFACRHLPVFWSAVCSGGVFLLLGIWGAVSFNSFFTAFHHLFFPGKTNWVFDPAQDEIICILPEQYFLLCAAVIVAFILTANLCCLLADMLWRKSRRPF